MSPEAAIRFLQCLGAKEPKYEGGSWVKSSCILAPWTHKGGRDLNPSFGINIEEGAPHYNCFTCRSGSLISLVQTLEMFLGPDLAGSKYDTKTARTILENEEYDLQPLPEFSEFSAAGQQFQEWPEYFIESFIDWSYSARAAKYLAKRGVSPAMATAQGLKYDSKKDMIVFPYRNVYGKLAGARGRAVELEGEEPKKNRHFDYTWNKVNNAHQVWYNEECLSQEPDYVVVVEGQFDCLRVMESYPYVLANLTAKPTLPKLRSLAYAGAVVVMTDNDNTGDTAAEKYVSYLASINKPVALAQPPKKYTDKGELIKQDPDSMGAEWIASQLQELGII